MMRELKIDPRTKFRNELWNALINMDQVYEEEWAVASGHTNILKANQRT